MRPVSASFGANSPRPFARRRVPRRLREGDHRGVPRDARPNRAEARHADLRRSGRVDRSAAGRALEPGGVTLALVASVRFVVTPHDRLLMSGTSPEVSAPVDSWRFTVVRSVAPSRRPWGRRLDSAIIDHLTHAVSDQAPTAANSAEPTGANGSSMTAVGLKPLTIM